LSLIERVSGPDFTNVESREAFARIEDSIRQFGTHSRETFALVRNPLSIGVDHFVLLWSRGSALVTLLPFGGRIRGGERGRWLSEEHHGHSVAETAFENPYELLKRAQKALEGLFQTNGTLAASTATADDLATDHWHGPTMSLIAVFTKPTEDIRPAEDLRDPAFSAVSLEYALSRTMFHLPNLLRISDRGSMVNTAPDIDTLSRDLDRAAAARVADVQTSRTAALPSFRRAKKRRIGRHISLVWVFAALVGIAVIYVIARPTSKIGEEPSGPDTTAHVPVHSHSTVVIRLPVETQLFVANQVFENRSALDYALAHGNGIRYLPDTIQVLQLDSADFAKGVYGYFKVENEWRKGKLLQTFRSRDTFVVDNFLEPLK
jgi:hypothetical protein